MDPALTKAGEPYGVHRYKEIVRERYFISKNSNTSYADVGKMTPTERDYIIEFISEEFKKTQEVLTQQQNKFKQP